MISACNTLNSKSGIDNGLTDGWVTVIPSYLAPLVLLVNISYHKIKTL